MPNNSLSVNRTHILLIAILGLALLLRLWGVGGLGLPRVGYVDDEPFFADAALELLRQDKLDFSKWQIGQLHIYLQAIIGKIILASRGVSADEIPTYSEIVSTQNITAHVIGVPYPLPEFYFWGRVVVAILGGFSVIILYFIGQAIKSSAVGLISAFFLAVISPHVEYSHYLIRTTPALFFLLLAFYAIVLACLKHKWWLYLLSFLFTYLAIYTKQNNLIILAPLGLALAISVWRESQRRSLREMAKYTGLILVIATTIFTLSWFFFQFNFFGYIQEIFGRIFYNSYYEGYHFGFSGQNTPQWLLEQIFLAPSANWRLIALLAIPGVGLALQLKEKGWLVLILLGPYLLMISLLTARFLHWLMPVIPLFALLAALTLERMYEIMSQRRVIKKRFLLALFTLIIILIPGASLRAVIILDYYASQPDIRLTASEWLEMNLPPGSKVVIDSWGPYLDASTHQVEYIYYIGDKDLQAYRREGVDYLVINSINLSRLISAAADPRAVETVTSRTSQLEALITELPLVQEFVGPALFNPPVITVSVYKVK